MNEQDFIKEVRKLVDDFISEWLLLNAKEDMRIERDLKEMEKESNSKTATESVNDDSYDPIEYDLKCQEKE